MSWYVLPWVQLPGTLWVFWTSWKSISFARLGKFSFITFSNKFSISCSSYSPSGTPMILMLECSNLSPRFLSLSSFFFLEFLFLYSVLVECLFLPSFCDLPQSFLWASWLPVFWTLHLVSSLSPCHLVNFLGFWPVLSFELYFFVLVHLLCCKGQNLRYSPGWGNSLCYIVAP